MIMIKYQIHIRILKKNQKPKSIREKEERRRSGEDVFEDEYAFVAKALGYKTQIKTGKHKLNAKAKKYTEHSWVVVNGKYILDSVRDDNNGKEAVAK